MKTYRFDELQDWSFEVDEVSAGVYWVRGRDPAGRNVEARGFDPDRLLKECKDWARQSNKEAIALSRHSLDDDVHERIVALCAKGDALAAQGQHETALAHYLDAMKLVPAPVEDWEAATWIWTAIGDVYFFTGKFSEGFTAFVNAVKCPGGLGNPFMHLRIGQCAFELGDLILAADELTRAYMGAGTDVFKNEDPKYLAFLKTKVKPPMGQDEL